MHTTGDLPYITCMKHESKIFSMISMILIMVDYNYIVKTETKVFTRHGAIGKVVSGESNVVWCLIQ